MRPRENDRKRFFNDLIMKTQNRHAIFRLVEKNARQGGPLNLFCFQECHIRGHFDT